MSPLPRAATPRAPVRAAAIATIAGLALAAAAAPVGNDRPAPPPAPAYRCLFNHELLIVCGNRSNSPAYIASFVEKLKDTDVDAVMCCPTAWRANLFPSEVDPQWKKWTPEQVSPKFPSFDRIMKYIHDGGDPVRETFDACRRCGKAFFISYRMNDHHYVTDKTWPTHNAFWREHPQYWLGDTDESPYKLGDRVRLLNYLEPAVRDYYFAILEELCTRYDVDGLELDFQRFPKFFRSDRADEGRRTMTAFVGRVREMLDRIGRGRGKALPLCVRVPETVAKCDRAGLDVADWDARGLVQMVNVSSSYIHTMDLGLEEFLARRTKARIYGEMNYVTWQAPHTEKGYARRYTTPEIYRASAFNLLSRGADGLSLFNYDYVPADLRVPMAATLKGITDLRLLRAASKDYAVYPGFGVFPATDRKTVVVIVPDNTSKEKFARSVLRVETKLPCPEGGLAVRLNGRPLEPCAHPGAELFPPLTTNAAYATRDRLAFFAVPLDRIIPGSNTVEIARAASEKKSCTLFSMELGLFK